MTAAPEQRDRIEDSIDVHTGLLSEEVLTGLWVELTGIDHWNIYGEPHLPGATTTAWFLSEFDYDGNLIPCATEPGPFLQQAKAVIDEAIGIDANQIQVNWYKPFKGAPMHIDFDKAGLLRDRIATLRIGAGRRLVADWLRPSEKRLDPYDLVPDESSGVFSRLTHHGDVLELRDNQRIKHGVAIGRADSFGVTFREHRKAV